MTRLSTVVRWGGEIPTLAADGLVLTALRAEDAEALLAMDRDPEVARRFDWDPADATLAGCIAHIERTRRWWADGERAAFAVREDAGGPCVGVVEARLDGGRVELSWMTAPDRRRRGVASRAVQTVCRWCLASGADAVWARVEPDNEASLRVAAAAGMDEERREGRWVHLVARPRPARGGGGA